MKALCLLVGLVLGANLIYFSLAPPNVKEQPKRNISLVTGAELEYLKESKSFSYCADPSWAPYEWIGVNGNHHGYVKDYLNLIEHALNVKFKLVLADSWSEVLEKAKRRECDFISAAMFTPERSAYLNFTQPFFSYSIVIASHKDIVFDRKENYFQGKTFALVKGYSYEEKIRRSYPKAKLVYVKNATEGLMLASAMKVDGYLDGQMVIAYTIHKEGLINLNISERLNEHMNLSLAVRSDDQVLLSIFNKAIDQITEKERRQIQAKWERTYTTTEEINTSIYWSFFYVSFIASCFLILTFIFRLRSAVNKSNSKVSGLITQLEKEKSYDAYDDVLNRYSAVKEVYNSLKSENNANLGIIIFKVNKLEQLYDELDMLAVEMLIESMLSHIKKIIPKSCQLGCWRGGRYILLCNKATSEELTLLAETVRYEVAKQAYHFDIGVTLSLVIGPYSQNCSINERIKEIEKQLSMCLPDNVSGKHIDFVKEQ
ncbi:transporter substrate-binding domain-containing protein [Pseudoalteromonas sp. JBTF-M23]|uniref:Transporter substrate-binding domain-containing protein n=1 Tax=Pseudoalteromonas caenipelagi TaxID=2726988 RepID=A0A849VBG7_9GAMM|nr:transporter substrate-binding domain-containing protein [Pseudoalteromonas caenipelagi]NOU50712.1 transporter substrate-binding domain-containing protein [Pseudoalteromonas caenipelagi]